MQWNDSFEIVAYNLANSEDDWIKFNKKMNAFNAYEDRIRRTGYPMHQYYARLLHAEGHPVMTRRP